MSRFIFAAFAFMVIFTVATTSRCPPKEVYKLCGTACEPNCTIPDPQVCTKQCVEGCFCVGNLVRNSERECIPLKYCDCDN